MCWCMIETSSDLPRKSSASSVIFGNFRKMSSETCAWLTRKLVGNPPKIVKKVNIFMVAYRCGISLLVFNLDIELNTLSSISTCPHAYTYNSRRDAFGTCLISLTPFIFMLLISTVSYSVKVYGPDTETENIMSMAVRIEGDERETKFKDLTNKATEGYDMYASRLLPYRWGPSG